MARPNNDPQHLAALQDYYAQHRLIPSYSAISALLGFSTKTAAASLVRRLEAAGFLRRTPDRRLTPTERFFERPRSVAAVRAGMPEAALDTSADMVNLDTLLVHKPSLTFFVPIRGDSMCEAGLLDGDTAICERRRHADPGDIVVALVDDELTIKTLAQEFNKKGFNKKEPNKKAGKRYVLKPENKAYPILRPDPLEIIGVVTGSFRSYRR